MTRKEMILHPVLYAVQWWGGRDCRAVGRGGSALLSLWKSDSSLAWRLVTPWIGLEDESTCTSVHVYNFTNVQFYNCTPVHLYTHTLLHLYTGTLVLSIMFGLECTFYSIQCTVYSVQCTLYSVQGTVYSVQCTVGCTLVDPWIKIFTIFRVT